MARRLGPPIGSLTFCGKITIRWKLWELLKSRIGEITLQYQNHQFP